MLEHSRLITLLSYNPETGVFRWLVKPNRNIVVGSVAGCARASSRGRGDIGIRIDGKQYAAHRLAWFYVNGAWPRNQIDHINCNAADNRICNLREATASQNQANKRKSRANKSGAKGVCWHQREGKWYASIRYQGRSRHLGRYDRLEDAKTAYWFYSTWFHGEYARVE